MENTLNQRKTYPRQNLSTCLQEQKGFALVFLISLLPLVLAALIFLYIATTQIEIKSTLQQTCRAELMTAQEMGSNLIKSLMALNKMIKLVKGAESLAVASMVLAVIAPPLFVVLQSSLQMILRTAKSAKKVLKMVQTTLLTGLGAGLELKLFEGHQKLSRILTHYSKKTKELTLLSQRTVFANYVRDLSVEPVNPQAELTEFRLKQDFEEKQKLLLVWRYQLKTNPTLFEWAPWHQIFHGYCSATLRKEEPWKPTLYADKSFWKFF